MGKKENGRGSRETLPLYFSGNAGCSRPIYAHLELISTVSAIAVSYACAWSEVVPRVFAGKENRTRDLKREQNSQAKIAGPTLRLALPLFS